MVCTTACFCRAGSPCKYVHHLPEPSLGAFVERRLKGRVVVEDRGLGANNMGVARHCRADDEIVLESSDHRVIPFRFAIIRLIHMQNWIEY